MADEKHKDAPAAQDAAKKKEPDAGEPDGAKDKDARLKELESENQKLKAQMAELQKELEKYRAKEKAAANRTRADKFLKKLEKDGMEFGDEEARETELERLAALTDEAFAATEAAFERLPKPKAKPKEEDERTGKCPEDKGGKSAKDRPQSKAAGEGAMRADAGVKPLVVDDTKLSLEERLKRGMMAAYRDRVAVAS